MNPVMMAVEEPGAALASRCPTRGHDESARDPVKHSRSVLLLEVLARLDELLRHA